MPPSELIGKLYIDSSSTRTILSSPSNHRAFRTVYVSRPLTKQYMFGPLITNTSFPSFPNFPSLPSLTSFQLQTSRFKHGEQIFQLDFFKCTSPDYVGSEFTFRLCNLLIVCHVMFHLFSVNPIDLPHTSLYLQAETFSTFLASLQSLLLNHPCKYSNSCTIPNRPTGQVIIMIQHSSFYVPDSDNFGYLSLKIFLLF